VRPKPFLYVFTLSVIALGITACLGLGVDPAVSVMKSVVVEGEALPEFSRVSVGYNTARVSGQIVGRLRCDTLDGEVKQRADNIEIVITVVSGFQGCPGRVPTTLSYIANVFNLKPGPTSVVVKHRFEGIAGVSGVRLDTLITVG